MRTAYRDISAYKPKGPKQGKRVLYRNVLYRSNWEAYIAKLLFYNEIQYEYEPRRFFFGKTSYLPDFYLKSFDCWLEIKGVMDKKSEFLIHVLSQKYKVLTLGKKEISEIHGKSISNISKMDVVNYRPEPDEIQRFREYLLRKT